MRSVVIIGSGFSGSVLATHLLRAAAAGHPGAPAEITLLERSGRFGPGLAYGSAGAAHLLNVPVGRMSAFADTPDDFLRWGLAHGHDWTGGSFVPRVIYGRYLQDTLNAADAAKPGVLKRVVAEALALRTTPSGVEVVALTTAGESAQRADAAVIACGNFAPGHPHPSLAGLSSRLYVGDPWAAPDQLVVDPTLPVLLVGTGLTMIDICLSLKGQGQRAPIHAVSRRGLLPQPHRVSHRAGKYAPHPPPPNVKEWTPTARELLKRVREEVRVGARRGIDWREIITSLRPVTQDLWRSLSEAERARFIEHVRPYWEIVRHRSAPTVDGQIQDLVLSGRLVIHSARIAAVNGRRAGDDAGRAETPAASSDANGVEVQLRERDGAIRPLRFGRVINCTGPNSDCRINGGRTPPSVLLEQLIREGVAAADPLGLGLSCDRQGRVIARDGTVHERVVLLGPLRKGEGWEMTAVPELRMHAADAAKLLTAL